MPLTETEINLGDFFLVNAPVERVRSFVLDPNSVVKCLPGIESYRVVNDGFQANFRVDLSDAGIPYLKSLGVDSEVKYKVIGDRISVEAVGRSVNFLAQINLDIGIQDIGNGTMVNWSANAKVRWPLVIFFGKGFVEKIARKNVEIIVGCIKEKLEKMS